MKATGRQGEQTGDAGDQWPRTTKLGLVQGTQENHWFPCKTFWLVDDMVGNCSLTPQLHFPWLPSLSDLLIIGRREH